MSPLLVTKDKIHKCLIYNILQADNAATDHKKSAIGDTLIPNSMLDVRRSMLNLKNRRLPCPQWNCRR